MDVAVCPPVLPAASAPPNTAKSHYWRSWKPCCGAHRMQTAAFCTAMRCTGFGGLRLGVDREETDHAKCAGTRGRARGACPRPQAPRKPSRYSPYTGASLGHRKEIAAGATPSLRLNGQKAPWITPSCRKDEFDGHSLSPSAFFLVHVSPCSCIRAMHAVAQSPRRCCFPSRPTARLGGDRHRHVGDSFPTQTPQHSVGPQVLAAAVSSATEEGEAVPCFTEGSSFRSWPAAFPAFRDATRTPKLCAKHDTKLLSSLLCSPPGIQVTVVIQ